MLTPKRHDIEQIQECLLQPLVLEESDIIL